MAIGTALKRLAGTAGHRPVFGALDILKYIGPGLLVTVGFIDPGNWASNIAAGADFGYALLWVVTLGTLMLIVLQHNVAHLGIASGLCLAEAATKHFSPLVSRGTLATAMLASIATSLAEILGAAIGLQMLFHIPIQAGAVLSTLFALAMLFSQGYKMIERWIIGFVSIIGISFIYELSLVTIDWSAAAHAWVVPSLPQGAILIVMSVLGAVVMPHNIFLHSEVIQSRQWNLENEKVLKRQLDYEFLDTLFSMLAGWAINSAMILLAAAVFFSASIPVTELAQAQNLLTPLLGKSAAVIFAVALLLAGVSACITSAMAAGTISAGLFAEPFDLKDVHSRIGAAASLGVACLAIFVVGDPFRALVISQVCLSIQLPITIWMQIRLTSDKKVMGKFANGPMMNIALVSIGAVVVGLNAILVWTVIMG